MRHVAGWRWHLHGVQKIAYEQKKLSTAELVELYALPDDSRLTDFALGPFEGHARRPGTRSSSDVDH